MIGQQGRDQLVLLLLGESPLVLGFPQEVMRGMAKIQQRRVADHEQQAFRVVHLLAQEPDLAVAEPHAVGRALHEHFPGPTAQQIVHDCGD